MEYFEESFVRWTVRLSVFCYLAFCLLKLAPSSSTGSTSSKRQFGIWTLGLIFFLLHFVSSMSFAHDWSHENAVTHTAEQTEAMTGWNWGGGIYFNYLFALIWLFDVVMCTRLARVGWKIESTKSACTVFLRLSFSMPRLCSARDTGGQ